MNKPLYRTINSCRIFPEEELVSILDLGQQPPANSLLSDPKDPEQAIPLHLMWSQRAGLAQLSVDVDPQYLFQDYVWVTGTSKTAQQYSLSFYEYSSEVAGLSPDSFIVEIASNDGTFLRPFVDSGMRVLGVDPAANIAEEARKSGIDTRTDFFSSEIAESILNERGSAHFVFARNVLPHVPDIKDVTRGIAKLVSEDGVAAVEFHYARDILKELHYDSIYHEHYFYYSLQNLSALFELVGLFAFDVRVSPISGGSLVLYLRKNQVNKSKALVEVLEEEDQIGLNDRECWEEFAQRSKQHAQQFKDLVLRELESGGKVVGYGASARSSTLLNYAGLDHEHLECIADKSELKHGLFTAGSHIPIFSPEKALGTKPDTIVLLAWNFEKEITQELVERGFRGKIIVPLPNEPRLVDLS